jgi:hypothetical protein
MLSYYFTTSNMCHNFFFILLGRPRLKISHFRNLSMFIPAHGFGVQSNKAWNFFVDTRLSFLLSTRLGKFYSIPENRL